MIELHIKLLFCDAFFRDALAFAMQLAFADRQGGEKTDDYMIFTIIIGT
jgi:hypothetical protein